VYNRNNVLIVLVFSRLELAFIISSVSLSVIIEIDNGYHISNISIHSSNVAIILLRYELVYLVYELAELF